VPARRGRASTAGSRAATVEDHVGAARSRVDGTAPRRRSRAVPPYCCGWATAPPRPMPPGQGSRRRGCRGRATGGVSRPPGRAATKAMRPGSRRNCVPRLRPPNVAPAPQSRQGSVQCAAGAEAARLAGPTRAQNARRRAAAPSGARAPRPLPTRRPVARSTAPPWSWAAATRKERRTVRVQTLTVCSYGLA
jgi:hypothetical protein